MADTSWSGDRVADEPNQIITERGKPKAVRVDNGTEFTSMAILEGMQKAGINWQYIARHSERGGVRASEARPPAAAG